MSLYGDFREYQIAREHERRLRTELDGILSVEDELAEASENTARYRSGLDAAMFDREIGKLLEGK